MVPLSSSWGTPCLLAAAIYRHNNIDAVALIVMEVLTRPIGMSLNKTSISSSVQMGTPTFPTSLWANRWSES